MLTFVEHACAALYLLSLLNRAADCGHVPRMFACDFLHARGTAHGLGRHISVRRMVKRDPDFGPAISKGSTYWISGMLPTLSGRAAHTRKKQLELREREASQRDLSHPARKQPLRICLQPARLHRQGRRVSRCDVERGKSIIENGEVPFSLRHFGRVRGSVVTAMVVLGRGRNVRSCGSRVRHPLARSGCQRKCGFASSGCANGLGAESSAFSGSKRTASTRARPVSEDACAPRALRRKGARKVRSFFDRFHGTFGVRSALRSHLPSGMCRRIAV